MAQDLPKMATPNRTSTSGHMTSFLQTLSRLEPRLILKQSHSQLKAIRWMIWMICPKIMYTVCVHVWSILTFIIDHHLWWNRFEDSQSRLSKLVGLPFQRLIKVDFGLPAELTCYPLWKFNLWKVTISVGKSSNVMHQWPVFHSKLLNHQRVSCSLISGQTSSQNSSATARMVL